MEVISQYMEALRALAAKLEPGRKDSGIVNDMFEAADDWKSLGRLMLEDERRDLRGRIKQEEELFAELRAFYGDALEQDPDYAGIMELGARLIAAGNQRKIDPDGYLGSMKIVRQTFAFLQTDFGLMPGPEPNDMWDYASDRVCVSLRLPSHYDSECRLKQLSDPDKDFALEDLLFVGGRSVSLALPAGQAIATEADVQAWFTTVADVLQRYGSDVLADRPGAFDRLARASAERERLINEECERLYRAETSNGPGAG